MRKLLGYSLFALGLAALPAPAFAAAITGHIGFSGGFIFDVRGGGLGVVDFAPVGPVPGGTGTGNVVTIDTATDYFAGIPTYPSVSLANATEAIIKDLTNDPLAAPATYAPAGTTGAPFPIANVVSGFSGALLPALYTTLHFDLTEIPNAAGAACLGTETIGQSCTEGPYTLTDTAEGLKVQFDLRGFFRNPFHAVNNPTGPDEGYYGGSFSAVINGLHFQSGANGSAGAFARIGVTGEDFMCGISNLAGSCTFSANFDPTNPVPEPATLLTFGVGAALVGLRRRRKNSSV